jgi:hypothetical protein
MKPICSFHLADFPSTLAGCAAVCFQRKSIVMLPSRLLVFLFLLLQVLVLPSARSFAASGSGDAAVLLQQGHFREALVHLQKARSLSPGDPTLKRAEADCRLAIGLKELKQGNLSGALQSLQSGQELAPKDGRFPLYLGYASLRLGKTGDAESWILEALQLSGPSSQVYALLGQVCYAQGRLYEAESYLAQALALKPEDEDIRRFLQKIRREIGVEAKMDSRYSGTFAISYVEGGEVLGDQALEVLENAYSELGSLFNYYPGQEVSVILYGNRDFSQVTGAPEWAGGAFDGKIRMPVGGLKKMTPGLRAALFHEYAHFLIRAITRGNIPLWLNEGLAQVAEEKEPSSRLEQLRRSGEKSQLFSFARLEKSMTGLSARQAQVAYAQCHDFVQYLLDEYGWTRMLELLESLGKGEPFDHAVARVMLYPEENFEGIAKWWVERNE